MAIVDAYEIGKERGSRSQAFPFRLRYTMQFMVMADHNNEPEDNVKAAVMTLGNTHPQDPRAVCIDIRADQVDDLPTHWYVRCEFSSVWDQVETASSPENFRPVAVETTRKIELPLVKDAVSGNPVINTAGDPYDPPLVAQYGVAHWEVRVNFLGRPNWLSALRTTCNNAPIAIYGNVIAIGDALMDEVEIGDQKHASGVAYWPATMQIDVDPVFHHRQIRLNDGMNQLISESGTVEKRKCQIQKEDAQSPQPLDASGRQIDPATLPGAAYYTSWNQAPLADWSLITFPV